MLIEVVPRVGTGGITIRATSLDFLAEDFLAEDFLDDDFLATDFLATDFLVADFLAAGFLAADFLATDFLVAGFLAGFFLVATLAPSNLEVSLTSPSASLLSSGKEERDFWRYLREGFCAMTYLIFPPRLEFTQCFRTSQGHKERVVPKSIYTPR